MKLCPNTSNRVHRYCQCQSCITIVTLTGLELGIRVLISLSFNGVLNFFRRSCLNRLRSFLTRTQMHALYVELRKTACYTILNILLASTRNFVGVLNRPQELLYILDRTVQNSVE